MTKAFRKFTFFNTYLGKSDDVSYACKNLALLLQCPALANGDA
jgi:hypothetical protein